jgi:glucosamine-6-phosphate deaminase
MNISVHVVDDALQVGETAAHLIAANLALRPSPVLGIATGSSPLTTYAHLAQLIRAGHLDVSRTSAFALDEYVGLPADHRESYRSVVDREVTTRLGLDPARVLVPDGNADDLDAACLDYEAAIRSAGGIDVQILGIGTNGHIGFNEPGTVFNSRTRIARLTPSTRFDNARYFPSLADVPTRCLTQGIGTILEARSIVLVASGEAKARAVAQALHGGRSLDCPASALQGHADVTFVLDAAAAHRLTPAALTPALRSR